MTVRKKGNKWYCRFQVDGVRYERPCKLAESETEAKKIETIIKTEILRGNYDYGRSENAAKLKDALKIFKNYSKINKLSHNTDLSIIAQISAFFGENTPLKAITPARVEEFKAWLKFTKTVRKVKTLNPKYGEKGVRKRFIYKLVEEEKIRSNATINRRVSVLSKIFNLAIDNGLYAANPCRNLHKLRENNFKIRFLTVEEEKRLLEVIDADCPYIKPIVICALQTGMRRGEILNLKWSQIDFTSGFIEVLKTKSGKPRKIPISNKLEKVLKNMGKNGEFVFINPETGKPYVSIKRAFLSALEKAEIKNFRFHDLRHTVATRMVEKGIDLAVVQEIMGHADITTTMRYSHPVPERKKQAIDVLSDYNAY